MDQYSVHVDVYDTEVSDSAGSAPIIKISGLCDAHGTSPHLMTPRSLSRLLDQATASKICEQRLHRFQSLQVFRDYSNPATSPTSAAVSPRSKDTAPLTDACGDLAEEKNVTTDVFLAHREERFFALRGSCRADTVGAVCKRSSTHSRAKCSATDEHPSGRVRARTCVVDDGKLCTPSRRAARRSLKRTTIPSRLSKSFREVENRTTLGSACPLDVAVGGASSAAEPLPGSKLNCMEEIVTIRHLPAAARRQFVRRHECETSLQDCWGSSDLSAVYRLLPSRRMQQGCQLAVSEVQTGAAEEEFREVYVSDCHSEWVDALGPSFPRRAAQSFPTECPGGGRARSHIRYTGHAVRAQETQTEDALQETLPSTISCLVEWFSTTCYDLVARLAAIHATEPDRSSPRRFSGASTDLWYRVMQNVQETMASVQAQPRDRGYRIDGMRGEGECPVERCAKDPALSHPGCT